MQIMNYEIIKKYLTTIGHSKGVIFIYTNK